MSRRESKLQAQSWVDDPTLMASDLREAIEWLRSTGLESSVAADGSTIWRCTSAKFDAVESATRPMAAVLSEYRRMLAHTTFNIDLFRPMLEAIADATAEQQVVDVPQFDTMNQQVTDLERWAAIQKKKNSEPAARSEALKATIEFIDDELILRTDKDGSIKLRGATNIPMFLAFWRAPGHRLGQEGFLDIDRRSNPKGLERHRTRLCSQLQEVLLEIVIEKSGLQMRRCRK
jgi:hypothetical protein